MSDNRFRPWLAAVLAFLYPGLGHAYLRSWFRALVWFGLALVTAALVVPESAVMAFENGGLDALIEASRSFPIAQMAPLLVIRVLNVADAYFTAIRTGRASDADAEAAAGTKCPACGKPLDDDLDFCPWCTTRLEPREDAEEGPESATREA